MIDEDAVGRGGGSKVPGFDAVRAEVISNELAAITEEMAIIIWKTGRSALLKTGDFATAVFDSAGRIVGQGFASPFQLAMLDELMATVTAKFGTDINPGDVIVSNDPHAGMGHLPDVAVVVPIFYEGELIAYSGAYSHHSDAGGRFPGGMSSHGRSLYEEGLIISPTKVIEKGHLNRPLLDLIATNIRYSDEWVGDLDAKIAGCRRGAAEMDTLCGRYGAATIRHSFEDLMERSQRVMQNVIAELPDGTWTSRVTMDDDGQGFGSLELAVEMTVSGDRLRVDFTGSSPQVEAGMNVPLGTTRAAVCGALKVLLAPDMPANAGLFRAIDILVPKASVLNPEPLAPVAGRAPVFLRIFDMLFELIGLAMPERAAVPGIAGDALYLSGTDHDGKPFAFLDLFFGGWGARPDKDGIDGTAPVYQGSYGSVPVELLERQYPVLIEGFGLVDDSEGAGRTRGAMSVFRTWRLLRPGFAIVRAVRPEGASDGIRGGHAGARGVSTLNGDALPKRMHVHLDAEAADVVHHETGGTGGYGPPHERAVEMVLEDVLDGKVSAGRAESVYGVVVSATGTGVDQDATDALREQIAQAAA